MGTYSMIANLVDPRDFWHGSHKAITALAWWYLNNSRELLPISGEAKKLHGAVCLKLWDNALGFGSENEPTTLTVYELFDNSNGKSLLVRQATWHSRDDLPAIWELVQKSNARVMYTPTISYRDAVLNSEHYLQLMKDAANFSIPFVWSQDEECCTTDVASRGFEYYSRDFPPAVLRLEWSVDTPSEWNPITAWVDQVENLLLNALDQSPE
jgi:hypothetical protein